MVSAPADETLTTRVKGLPDSIDPGRPPKSYKEAMYREDSAELAEAYNKEAYNKVNREFSKRKSRLCAMGSQQAEGTQYNAHDLHAPVLKSTE